MSVGRFRKKPVEVEVMRLEQDAASVVDWITSNGGQCRAGEYAIQQYGRNEYPFNGRHSVWITTLEGDMRADPGDYVIKGVKGEFYPCKPDIFDATYEALT